MMNLREQRDWKMPDFQLLHSALNPRTPWPPNGSLHSNAIGSMPRKPPSKPPKPSNTMNADTDLLDLGAFNAPVVPAAPIDIFTTAPNPFTEVTSPLAAAEPGKISSVEDPFSGFLATNERSSDVSSAQADDPFSTVLNALQSSSVTAKAPVDDDPFAGL